jgi:glutamate formiminotransferase
MVVTDNSNVTLATCKANLSNGYKNEWIAHIPVETEVHDRNVLILVKDQAGNITRCLMTDSVDPPLVVKSLVNSHQEAINILCSSGDHCHLIASLSR